MKPALAFTAVATVLASHSFAAAAQASMPASPDRGQTSGQGSPPAAADGRWGNAPAAGSAIRLAEPSARPPVSTPPDAAARHDEHRPKATAAKPLGRAKHAAAVEPPDCSNLPAKWLRSQQLARQGHVDEAYASYVALLHACNTAGAREGTAWKAVGALPPAYVDRLLADPAFDAPALRKTRSDIELQRMYSENSAGRYETALHYSRSLRADPSVQLDVSALEVSGWLEEQAHDDRAAEGLFREALERKGDLEHARQGLALSLMHQGRLDEAQAQSRALTTPAGRRLHARIMLARAKESGNAAQVDAAVRLIDETGGAADPATHALIGWALLSSERPAQAEDVFSALHREQPDNEEYLQGLAYSSAGAHDYATLEALEAENKTGMPAPVRETLAEHDARRARYAAASAAAGHPIEGQEPALQGLMDWDRKSGAAGQDKLTVWTIPQLSATLLPGPTLSLRIDADLLRLDDGVRHAWGKQMGVTARTDWNDGELSAGAAAQSPGRGPTELLGKIRYQRFAQDEASFFRITATREGIYDSLRAYEGSASGPGPAISSSLELAARQTLGSTSWHVGETVAGGAVTATGTAFNPFYAVALGVTRDFAVKGWSWLNAGPELRMSSYRYDANRFDGPYARYWSPRSNREAGLVFNAQSAEGGRVLFKTSGRVGYATRELFTGRASGAFGEDTTSLAMLAAPNVIVGAGIGYRASPGYEDISVFAWLKIPLDARAHLRAADLVTPRGF